MIVVAGLVAAVRRCWESGALKEFFRTLLRTVQTWFPGLVDAKYVTQRSIRRVLRRPFEQEFRAVQLLGLPVGALILDVGANRGQSIDALRLVVPGRRVIAFEPNPLLADRLRRHYAQRPEVDVRAIGLGDEAGVHTLHVPAYNGYVFDGLASFDEAAARGWLDGRLFGYKAANVRIHRVICEVKRLDDLGLAPSLIKLDVQGFELQALRGGPRTLERYRPALLVEAPPDELVSYLNELQYRPYLFTDGHLVEGLRGGANTFFLAGFGSVVGRVG